MVTLALVLVGLLFLTLLFFGLISLLTKPCEDLTEEEQLRELDDEFEWGIEQYQLRNRIRNLR